MYPSDMKYSSEHEWVRVDGDFVDIGVTVFAQDSLGDVVFINLPNIGTDLEQFVKFGEIESVKAVSDLFSPIAGKVVEVNQEAIDNPAVVNEDPYGKGWLIKVKISDTAQLDNLMDAESYESTLG